MSEPQPIEKDLREYLEKEPNLRREDRLLYLKTIFDKHFTVSKLDHMLTNRDLFDIVSDAGANFSSQRLPMSISKKQVEQSAFRHVATIEAFISYLNRMNLLKRLVKFDYTD